MAVAVALLDRRDLGAGLIPARGGPAPRRRMLTGPFPLVTKLARGTIIGWAVGVALGGVVVGSLLGSVADMVDDPAIKDLLEKLGGSTGTVEDVYLATEIHFVAVAVAAAGIALVLRLVASERSGLGEVVLATPTSRPRWFGAHVALPVVLTTALMALLGAVVGLVGPSASAERAVLRCLGRRHPGRAARRVGDDRCRRRPRGRRTPVRTVRVGRAARDLHGHRDRPAHEAARRGSWTSRRSRTCRTCPAARSRSSRPSVLTLIALALMVGGFLAYRRRDVA